MQAELWRKIDSLWKAVLAQPPEKRAAFLAEACPDDSQLRAEVESLLNQQTDSFLEGWSFPSVKTLSAGTKLGNFEIVELLGTGGMGEVYRARDLRLKREVAIKLLPPVFAASRDRVERFEREARSAAAINHPNICTLYEVGEHESHPFLVMELLEGATLAQRIGHKPLPLDMILNWAIQIAGGLEAAHARRIIHRDIKPANLFITDSGQAKILDFGLAKLAALKAQVAGVSADGSTVAVDVHTTQGTVAGTPGYTSPEQARGEEIDARTDLFSLGVVLYEMATGRLPFAGKTPAALMAAILHDTPKPASDVNPDIPPKLEEIIARAIEKDPDLRYQSAADLRAELKRLKRDVDSSDSHDALRPASAVYRPRPRRKLYLAYALGAAVIVAAAGLVLLARPLRPPRITGTVQVSNDGRPKTFPLLPDGSRLLFNSNALVFERFQISVKGGDSVPLPVPVTNSSLEDISPDHTELLLCRDIENNRGPCELWAAPLLGGPPRRLGNLLARLGSASWSPDGQQIVYARDKDIRLAHSDGSGDHRLTTVANDPFWARWSPDSTRVRFSVDAGPGAAQTLWEARIEEGRAYPLLRGWNPSGDVCCGDWTPDGKYFVFEAHVNGHSDIFALRENVGWFPRAERGPFQLTNGPMKSFWPAPSSDGKRLFIGGSPEHGRLEFLRYDPQTDRLFPDLSGISGTELEFSKDGKWVAYVDAAEDGSLWRAASDGSQPLRLTSPPVWARHPHWSPDGQQIAFNGGGKGEESRIYLVPFEGGPLKPVSNGENGKGGDWDPSWSPDGASLAFGCDYTVSASPGRVVRVVDLKTGGVSILPGSEGMWSPRWSPSGTLMAGLASQSGKALVYDFQTRRQAEVSSLRASYPSWSPDGESLFYVTGHADGAWWKWRWRDRKTERIAPLRNKRVFLWFAPAPNNTFITTHNLITTEIYALDWDAP
jgi:serine/threonine protein kinase/Tol biopolymer transport system component